MSFSVRFLAVGFFVVVLSVGSVFAQRNSLEIHGDARNIRTWSIDDIKKQFVEETQTVSHWFEREAYIMTCIPMSIYGKE